MQFEDRQEKLATIFEELIRFSQRDRAVFPNVRFQQLLKNMTQP